jgi:DNA gyrase inhibitor GyrI
MRQQHHYAGVSYNDNIETPPDNYSADTIGSVSMDQLQQQRTADISSQKR